jgi:hypothetical protein
MTEQAVNPPVRRGHAREVVIFSGVATSALALLAAYALDRWADWNVMGLYGNYVIPWGAVLVGTGAGAGYSIASWFTGVRINKGLLVVVILFQIWTYFLAQYLQYQYLVALHPGLAQLGFFPFFDLVTRAFAWKQDNGLPGNPLGGWGYAFKALEISGFVAGGLILPAVLYKYPYCEDCGVYMRRRELAVIPASVSAKELKKINKQAQTPEDRAVAAAMPEAAIDHAKATLANLSALAAAGEVQALAAARAELAPESKAARKLPRRIVVSLCGCNRCGTGRLQSSLWTGQGKRIRKTRLVATAVSPAIVTAILNPAGPAGPGAGM